MHIITKQDIINARTVSFAVIFLLATSMSVARAEAASDFTSDVQSGLRTAARSAIASNIKTQDYQTSWDEFGTNILVDGASASAEIQKGLTDDIVSSLQTELAYDQKDERYLRLQHSSPEDVMVLEGDGSGDLLPENYIDPNPSLNANPNVNLSALDVPISAVDMLDTFLVSDVGTTPDTETIIQGDIVPPEGAWNPSELKVFEAILNADVPVPDAPPNTPSDAETPSPADAPTN